MAGLTEAAARRLVGLGLAAVFVLLAASCSSGGDEQPREAAGATAVSGPELSNPGLVGDREDRLYELYRGPIIDPDVDCAWAGEPYRCYTVALDDVHVSDGGKMWTRVVLRPPVVGGRPAGIMYADIGPSPGYDDLSGLAGWVEAKGSLLDRWYVFAILPVGLDPGAVRQEKGGILTEAVQYPRCDGIEDIIRRGRDWMPEGGGPGLRLDSVSDAAEEWSDAIGDCTGFDYDHIGPQRHAWVIESVRVSLLGGQLPITIVSETGGTAGAAAYAEAYPDSLRRAVLVYPDTDWGEVGPSREVDHAMAGWNGTGGYEGFVQWCAKEAECVGRLGAIADGELDEKEDGYLEYWVATVMMERYPEAAAAAELLAALVVDPSRWADLSDIMASIPPAWPVGGYPPREDDLDGDGLDEFGRRVPKPPVYDSREQTSEELREAYIPAVVPGPANSGQDAELRMTADLGYRCSGGDVPSRWRRELEDSDERLRRQMSLWMYLSSPSAKEALGAAGEDVSELIDASDLCSVMMSPREFSAHEGYSWPEGLAIFAVGPVGRADITDPLSEAWDDIADRERTMVLAIEDRVSAPWHDRSASCVDSWIREFIETDPASWEKSDGAACRVP